jgi:uncharacterized repeat protein (TIGR04076 family)
VPSEVADIGNTMKGRGSLMFSKCKITVARRMVHNDLAKEYLDVPYEITVCDKVGDGQSFVTDNPYELPNGMCASAWADIRPYLIAIASGGMFKFMKDENTMLASCADPIRPVLFMIERYDD